MTNRCQKYQRIAFKNLKILCILSLQFEIVKSHFVIQSTFQNFAQFHSIIIVPYVELMNQIEAHKLFCRTGLLSNLFDKNLTKPAKHCHQMVLYKKKLRNSRKSSKLRLKAFSFRFFPRATYVVRSFQ